MIRIAAVCGVGMGSSLLLRMYTEDVLRELGIEASVEALDASLARGARVDLILTSPVLVEACSGGQAAVKGIRNFVDKNLIRAALQEFLHERGQGPQAA